MADTDQMSYINAVLLTAEHEKKKYLEAGTHATFTPFVVSDDVVLGHEVNAVTNCFGRKK